MDVSPRVQLSSSFDKRLDEIVVLFAPYPTLMEAEIEFIVKQIFIVCTAVHDYREGSVGMNTSAEGRKSQLCSRYENATNALQE